MVTSVLKLSFKRYKTMTMDIFDDQFDHKDSESVLELVSKPCFIEWLNVPSDSFILRSPLSRIQKPICIQQLCNVSTEQFTQ